jgi:hypothetical protein
MNIGGWMICARGVRFIWAHLIHAVYGKKRTVLEEYTKLARQGKYEEAYTLWNA